MSDGPSNDNERRGFTVPFTCACGKAGSVVWEENSQLQPQGLQRRLVSVSDGFHAEEGRTQSGDPLVICDACDTIQDD